MGTSRHDPAGDLEEAHKKAKAVKTEVQRAADHAAVIGIVLAQELPDDVQVGDVAQAIEQTEELEQKLADSATTLAEVSAELGREVKKRRKVTAELTKSRARVDKLSGAKKTRNA